MSESDFVHEPASTKTEAGKPGNSTAQEGQAATTAQAMLRGQPQPNELAALLRKHPDARDEIMALLNTQVGMAFARSVLALAEGTASSESKSRSSAIDGSATATTPQTTNPSGNHEPVTNRPESVEWGAPRLVRVTATDRLNVRDAASKSGSILGGLSSNEEVEAIGQEGEWYRIHHNGHVAFINAGFAVFVSTSSNTADTKQEVPTPPAPTQSATAAPTTQHAPPATAHDPNVADQTPVGHVEPVISHAPKPPVAAAPPAPSVEHTGGGPSAGAHSPEPATPAHAPPTTATATLDASNFVTASGNSIANTTKGEAAVLNKLRREPRRFDPIWLATAQHALGVADATGAFNTETLRAMRVRAHNPALDVAGIMDTGFLSSIAPGAPFHEGTEIGTLDHAQAATKGATSPKDKTAQDVGYASFAAYREAWGDDAVTFLGNDFGTPAHPYLRARLRVAETYLRNRVKSPEGHKLDDAAITKAIGWNGKGNASYAHDGASHMTHQHAMGLAVDFDAAHNPYLFDHSVENADFWVSLFEHLFKHATKLYGGDPVDAATLMKWSQESSTEELFQRVSKSSHAFEQLLSLSARAGGNETPKGEIYTKLAGAGYEGAALTTAVHEVAVANHHFHLQEGRSHASAPTNLTQELVIALRDVAGLAWGGTEMSSVENGDFMHFDCRLTDYGNAVYQAGRRHK